MDKYISPAPAVYPTPAGVIDHVTPDSVDEHICTAPTADPAPAPVIEHMVPDSVDETHLSSSSRLRSAASSSHRACGGQFRGRIHGSSSSRIRRRRQLQSSSMWRPFQGSNTLVRLRSASSRHRAYGACSSGRIHCSSSGRARRSCTRGTSDLNDSTGHICFPSRRPQFRLPLIQYCPRRSVHLP